MISKISFNESKTEASNVICFGNSADKLVALTSSSSPLVYLLPIV
jgi:hypothetical protein